jgi:hypothetical protein
MAHNDKSRVLIYKASAIAGGIFFLLQGVAFTYSHGTTPQNRELPILGMEQAVALFLVAFLCCLCLFIALFGFKKLVVETGKIGKVMFRVTQASIIALFGMWCMQVFIYLLVSVGFY